MTIHTRIATVADLAPLAGLFDAYRQFYEQAPDLEAARNFIQARFELKESEILVAEDDAGQLVGFCQLYPSFCSIEAKRIYILSDLFVSPEARRLGAGRALLVAAEKHAAQTGRIKMELTTARTNKTAQSAYESLGWELDEVFLGYSKRVEA
ncbi:GNAT family N-acetyltransferase [Hydrogenophaga sp. MI9]|uniref:GNAT family N-acetyltransferase n=1 Tax=Hydrogenophaga sp. MI9 TaxID=3453719 RepID=UPI003EE8288E